MKIHFKKQVVILWLIVLFVQILTNGFHLFSGKWYFKSSLWANLFWSVHFCSLVALFIIPFLHQKTYKALTVLALLIWSPIVFFQFNPIDTSTFPNDVKVLEKKEAYKQVVREQQNMKTLMVERDTVWVEDQFIFRRILKGYD